MGDVIDEFLDNKKTLKNVLSKLKTIETDILQAIEDCENLELESPFDYVYGEFTVLVESGKLKKKKKYLTYSDKIIPSVPELLGYQVFLSTSEKEKSITGQTPHDYMNYGDILCVVKDMGEYLEYLKEQLEDYDEAIQEPIEEDFLYGIDMFRTRKFD